MTLKTTPLPGSVGVNSTGEGEREYFFILSAGRTATVFLRDELSRCFPKLCCLHEPPPARWELMLGNLRKDFGIRGRSLQRWIIQSRVRRVAALTSDMRYVELNPMLCPVTEWLRALAADLHSRCGGPGVGAVGMCFTGGFGLAMMADPSVIAPVLSQPSVPLGPKPKRDLGMSDETLEVVKERVAARFCVMGLLRSMVLMRLRALSTSS